jgi:hypothetical protein
MIGKHKDFLFQFFWDPSSFITIKKPFLGSLSNEPFSQFIQHELYNFNM